MSRKRVFLSRVSGEFSDLGDSIRDEGNEAFPMLLITDQNHPPAVVQSRTSTITVNKIWEWIRASDHVFLYIGTLSGAEAKVPPSERKLLEALLDPNSQQDLDNLLNELRSAKVPETDLTYTQLEGVISIGLRKEPLVFWLEGEALDSSQSVYRSWIRKHYLSGRDRFQASDVEGLSQGSRRRLQELNTRAQLEQLSRSTSESPLWEIIRILAQPGTGDDELLEKSAEIRKYSHSLEMDWIEGRIDCCSPLPDYVFRALDRTNDPNSRCWLFLGQESSAILDNAAGKWEKSIVEYSSIQHRAECFHEGDFWCIAEDRGAYSLRRLGPASAFESRGIAGLNVKSFDPMALFHSGSHFHLRGAGRFHRIDEAPDASELLAKAVAAPSCVRTSNAIPVFPEPYAFPFRRGFSGSVYECQSSENDRWALAKTEDRATFLSFRPGSFLDLFQTVDVSLEGIWDFLGAECCIDGIWHLTVRRGEGITTSVPLFRNDDFPVKSWRKNRCTVPLLSKDLGGRGKIYEMVPDTLSKFDPFCFVHREVIENVENDGSTRIRVWLVPSVFNRSIIERLDRLTNGLEPLPHSPICSFESSELIDSLEGWWLELWNYPFHNLTVRP